MQVNVSTYALAGSLESDTRPAAAAINLAATDVPTNADRFGAMADIRDSTYYTTTNDVFRTYVT